MTTLHALGAASLVFVFGFTLYQAKAKDDTPAGRQTRWQSIIEAWQNIAIGLAINWSANFLLLPLVGAKFTPLENLMLGCVFTAISIIRQYIIRRWWEKRLHLLAQRAAAMASFRTS